MNSIIGIDLGTTYSAAAQFDEFGRPVMVADQDGKYLVPSCVALIDNKWQVGRDALGQWAADQGMDQKFSAARFKREMGTSKLYQIGSHSVTPADLSSHVLKHIVTYAEKAVGTIAPVVITVPANFGDPAREATIDAAKAAGLVVACTIDEPSAAALYYAYDGRLNQAGTYAVFDLGGGTFDITIAKIDGTDVKVEWTNGIAQLGGIDFDESLRSVAKEKYEMQAKEELTFKDMSQGGVDLRRIQELKELLSRQEKGSIFLKGKIIEVTREEFESSISELVAEVRLCCEKTLAEGGFVADNLDGVILAGGSTRIPVVQQCVREVFGKEPMSIANADEVVALGASLYAGCNVYEEDPNSMNELQEKAIRRLNVEKTTTKHFGTVALRWDDDTERTSKFNSIIIEKGTDIPCQVTETYYTVAHDQKSVNCRVTECDVKEEDIKSESVKIIGKATLPLPPGRPPNQEVRITYKYDKNQIMHCYFKDIETGEEVEIEKKIT